MSVKRLLDEKIPPTKKITPAGNYLYTAIDENDIKNINELLDFLHHEWELMHKKHANQNIIGAGGPGNRERKNIAEHLKVISSALKLLDESL